MPRPRILVVDDEEDVLQLVEYNLGRNGMATDAATGGEDALKAVRADKPDLIVLDLMLPGVDGLELCRRWKSDAATRDIPILMLTAKGEEADIVAGLEAGADDYVTKPFSPRILVARVKAALRRKASAPAGEDDLLQIEGLSIHPGRHEVRVDGQRVELTATEFRILHLLARQAGWVLPRSRIVEAVQGHDAVVTDRSVDVHIVALRRKLGPYAERIQTVRGVGYRFKDE